MAKITVFAQVIQKLPKYLIKSLVRKHGTDKHAKGFNTIYNTIYLGHYWIFTAKSFVEK